MDKPLNCRQGDLAIVIKSEAGNEGRIVRCLEFVGGPAIGGDMFHTDCWRVEGVLTSLCAFTGERIVSADNIISDSRLRPLRDGEDTDEIILLVGLPNPTKTLEIME